MANIYGVCPERALQHKGYSDFVQHTNPLKEGLLRLVLNEPQTLQVTIGYLQNQAANMPLAYSSLKSFQNPNSGFATNLLKKFQTVNLQSAQTLCNSFRGVQITIGETPSLKLKADNSLIGLISVREPELVNPLLQLNYRESRELANSLIQLNSVDSTESANSSIMSKTCIAGTSPGVLVKFDSDNFPSRDDTQNAQKEKGSTANAAFLHNVDGDQSLSCLAILRWRRLISPLAAVTKKPAVLSPSSLSDSIFSITSCGIRTVVICDFAFFAPVTITDTPWDWCMSVYAKKITKKGLWCISLEYSLCCEGEIHLINCEARKCANTNRASIHNVTGANTMAFTHSTQTRPKFTYLFLGTPSDLPTCTPTVLRAEADTEAEARSKFIDWDLTFAAQIRTAAPSRLQLFSTDDGFMWIYEQRQEASHA
ncbi:host cell division inhibitor Icd-like protein [Hafnia alvei]|uniref:Host cell division inhibitor Icd-like protein n=3 Tax=Hafnia alvei TaxID=569 RepID=A0A377PGE3_HAFAL|nr:hypothetical protein GHAL_1823 [Hafnia alvei ATCC 13337]RLR08365.1 host cell division inhibitor Icd-like protein [Hafnia alvei ATCC 13337]STQ79192.1 Uncharacterised protein [Hafnia alvei]